MSNDIADKLETLAEDISGEGDSYDDANTCAEGAILIRKQAATIAELKSRISLLEDFVHDVSLLQYEIVEISDKIDRLQSNPAQEKDDE